MLGFLAFQAWSKACEVGPFSKIEDNNIRGIGHHGYVRLIERVTLEAFKKCAKISPESAEQSDLLPQA